MEISLSPRQILLEIGQVETTLLLSPTHNLLFNSFLVMSDITEMILLQLFAALGIQAFNRSKHKMVQYKIYFMHGLSLPYLGKYT